MANMSGRVVQVSPSVFTWKLRSKSRNDVCTSESIYICENKYEFYFRLFKIREKFYTLHLLNPQIVFVKLDMHIVVNFYGMKIDPKVVDYEVIAFDHFIIGIAKDAREISDITFTFSNAQDLKKPGFETAKFFNMTRKLGKLVQMSPATFTWKLDNDNRNVKVSDNIQICGNKYKFYFRLIKIREDFYTLHLLNPQIVFVKLNINIVTRSHTTTDYTLENYKVKSFDQFILGISDARGISEITFSFSSAKDLKNPVLETTKIIHRMLNMSRNTDQTSSSKCTWKLSSETRKSVSTSETMYVCGNKYEFHFRLFKMREDFYTLHLLNPEIDFVKLDMHIVVKFSEISTDYTLDNYEVKSFDQFILGISHAKDISEITFTFSNAQDLKKHGCESGEPKVLESKAIEELKKLAVGFVPHCLSEEQKQMRMGAYGEIIDGVPQTEIISDSPGNRDHIGTLPSKINGDPRVLEELKNLAVELHGKITNIKRNELEQESGCGTLITDLKNAFLSGEDSDIILKVGDQQYPAHKVIIRNRSSVFRAMLQHDMTEKKEGIVDIEDCDPYIFRDFLLYLYTGKLDNISNENVFELYYISDKYVVNQLKLDCVDYIVNNLKIDIICDVISLAIKHSEHDLLKYAIDFFMLNAEDIFITVQWQKFLIENPVQANELIIKSFKSDSRKQKTVDQKHK